MDVLSSTRVPGRPETSIRSPNRLRDAVIIGLMSLVLLAALEFAARRYERYFRALREGPDTVLMRQEWGPQYVADVKRYNWRTSFQPYVDFRHVPYSSKTINVGSDGTRQTPGSCENRQPSMEVFTFGGSTMLGMGVPDEHTIAAYLATALNQGGACVRVVNHATAWWQSSQSLAELESLLRSGKRPDVVIFYDGINDINVLTFGGHAGGIAPWAETLLQGALRGESHPVREWLHNRSALYRTASRLVGPQVAKDEFNSFSLSEDEIPAHAASIASVYVHNVRMLRALEAQYGFRALAVLQPFPLVVKKPLREEEKSVVAQRLHGRPWEPAMISAVYDLVRRDGALVCDPGFVDLSRVFDGVDEMLFVDGEHLLPRGNEIVALKLAGLLNDDHAPRAREAALVHSDAAAVKTGGRAMRTRRWSRGGSRHPTVRRLCSSGTARHTTSSACPSITSSSPPPARRRSAS